MPARVRTRDCIYLGRLRRRRQRRALVDVSLHGSSPCVSLLGAARNLLRDQGLPASFLAERQHGMAAGQRDTATQGIDGDIRFPDWARVLQGLLRNGEVIVRFNPQRAGPSALLHDVRVMAMAFVANTHVVAVLRDDAAGDAGARARVTFRKYDNDSDARRRGTFERVSARQLWVGSCEMVAITARGSPLHSVVGDVRPGGALRAERARLRMDSPYIRATSTS